MAQYGFQRVQVKGSKYVSGKYASGKYASGKWQVISKFEGKILGF